MATNQDSPLSALLLTSDKEGNPTPEGQRIADLQSGYSVYKAMYTGDMYSALNRARYELVAAGYPPYDPEMLRQTGQEGIANINPGLLKTYLTESCTPLLDQLNTPEKYINIQLKYVANDDTDWSDPISVVEDEHYTLLKSDPSFSYRKIELVRQMVMHGITVPFFQDSLDYRWKSVPIGEFLIPHMTPATEDSVEVACITRSRNPHELAKYLDKGNKFWNKAEIKQALLDARPRTIRPQEWERAVSQWKGNDLWITSQAAEVTTVDMFVTEMSGKVSHYIMRQDGGGSDYLYKNIGRFASQSEAYQFFTLDIATDGFYHSIRGLASEAMPIVQEINRVFSSFMDAMRLGSKLAVQASDEDALQNLTFIEHSGFLVLPTGVSVVEKQMPNTVGAILPGLEYLSGFLNRKMAHFNTDDAGFGDSKRRTKGEIMANVARLAQLGEGNTDLLNQSWDRLIVTQFRKICRKNYRPEEPGGENIARFKKRCKDRGVPDEFWDKIDFDRCSSQKAVGAGSAAQQIMVMERLMEFFDKGFFDAEGEYFFKKDATRLFTNKEQAERYVGQNNATRPPQDAKNAEFENQLMSLGKQVQVFDNDNNQVHAQVHIGQSNAQVPTGSLSDDINALEQAIQTADNDLILQLVPAMTQKHSHTEEHVMRMRNAPLAAKMRQELQQIGGVIENAQKKMLKIQEERAQQQQQMQAQQGQPGQDPKVQQDTASGNYALERQIVEAQVALKNNQEVQDQKLANEQAKADQDIHNKDRKAAQDIQITKAKQLAAAQFRSGVV